MVVIIEVDYPGVTTNLVVDPEADCGYVEVTLWRRLG
jgi:hypothetical protein